MAKTNDKSPKQGNNAMAEEKNASPSAAPARKKFPVKTMLVLGAVLLVEAAAISAAFLLTGKPAEVKAQGAAIDEAALAEQPVEELVVADKFQNTRSGKIFIYDTEIFIVVRRKHQDQTKEDIKAMQAALSTDIATIFRRAEPSFLTEPTLATLTRQIRAALEQRLKKDEQGASVVQEVFIRKCTQLPVF